MPAGGSRPAALPLGAGICIEPYPFPFLSSRSHLPSSFKLGMFISCLNCPLLENFVFNSLGEGLKSFLSLPVSFQANRSYLRAGDQPGFIQLCTKWDLLCVSLLGLRHPLNFCSVVK